MAVLNAAQRKRIPASKFGVPSKAPGSGSFPMPDAGHAANAKARATQGVKRGTLSSEAAARIRAKADRILGKSKK